MVTAESSVSFRFALVGAGRVGTAVALLLAERGHVCAGVASRSEESAARAARRLDTEVLEVSGGIGNVDVVLIGAPEKAIAGLAASLSRHLDPGTTVVHFAGSLGLAPLAAVIQASGHGCALHPVQACPDVDTARRRLPGSAWGLTCSPGAKRWASWLVESELKGRAVPVDEHARRIWHAAAVTTSNGIAALLAAGESMLSAIDVQHPQVVLGPLAEGTVNNAAENGGARSLTGPVVRGETATIEGHVAALRRSSPELAGVYIDIVDLILSQAARAGRVDPRTERAMRSSLKRS